MKFVNSEKDLFYDKTFSNIEKSPQNSNILILPFFVTYYNRWHQSIKRTSIEMVIKISLEKALIIKFRGHKDVKLISNWDVFDRPKKSGNLLIQFFYELMEF